MIDIKVDEKAQEMVKNILSEIPRGAEKSLREGFRAGAKAYEKTSDEESTKIYAISPADIKKGGKAKISSYGTSASVTYSGNKIELFKFAGRPKMPVQGAKVYAQQVRSSSGGIFPHAFVAMMRSGHTGIFERKSGNGRLPITEMQAVARAQMAGRSDVAEKANEAAREKSTEAIDRAISEILNKY